MGVMKVKYLVDEKVAGKVEKSDELLVEAMVISSELPLAVQKAANWVEWLEAAKD
jgi:hypothetical protein